MNSMRHHHRRGSEERVGQIVEILSSWSKSGRHWELCESRLRALQAHSGVAAKGSSGRRDAVWVGCGSSSDVGIDVRVSNAVGPGHSHALTLVLHASVLEPHLIKAQKRYEWETRAKNYFNSGGIMRLSNIIFM